MRILYAKEDSSFQVVSISAPEGPVVAVGDLAGLKVGERARLRGRRVVDRRFGPQLKVRTFVPLPPSTRDGIERYLASREVKGIGPVIAKRIVEHFGDKTLEVIDKSPERLFEVPGIGKRKKKQIAESWAGDRDQRESLVFLQAHGLTAGLAQRVWKQYGPNTPRIVRESPYRLAVEVSGIGFRTADELAGEVGIPRDGPERARAGLLFVLGELQDAGHVYSPRTALISKAEQVLGISTAILESAVESLSDEGRLVVEVGDDEPVYLRSLFDAEQHSATRLRRLIRHAVDKKVSDTERAIAGFEQTKKIQLAENQRRAVAMALEAKVMVITGGPGTGKTTIIRAILGVIGDKERVVLAAPTGRAAKRMNEATGQEAKTIHRLLEFDPISRLFRKNASDPIEADVLIVDETSMVDVTLLSYLLDAVPDDARLVFVGDSDQLPSVGPGTVLRDLISSEVIPVVRLNEVFRQAETSLIVANAHRVNRGQFPESREGGDFFFLERDSSEDIIKTLELLVGTRIPRAFGLDPIEDIQVLTPMNRGLLGTQSLNVRLQALLNPIGPVLERGERVYRLGDKVMQIRNNYDLEVWNGDVGRVVGVDGEKKKLSVRFDDRRLEYEANTLDELVPAYACSIHKSQGSEFPAAVIPLHGQHYMLLKRNLIYTAITRAKRLVVIVGTRAALEQAIRSNDVARRWSKLWARLRQGLEPKGGG
ncbi:MAG: ATP-dependent RecD-like DNA helicase [Deltaproteobacteria bacterium]|nr:ATP-dependent RecD-like DNA helicase [Deltaproteobacteria bacterium]